MPDINVNKLSEILNTKADIDLNNTGVFSTSGGGVNLVQSTSSDAKGKEVVSADFSLKQGGLELMDIIFAPLGIDESENKRRYLNGQVISQSQFPAFTAAVKARMSTMANAFTTEVNWQAEKTNSKLGQCGKFVIDDTAGTIRLPCVVNAQGLADLSLIGGIKNESLPNITGSFKGQSPATGAFNYTADANIGGGGGSFGTITFDASRSSSTYQDNAPVQQEAVQYPYCIQVATSVEETLPAIREYKVNNSDYFGKSMYSNVVPGNASWLISAGQWNAKATYPDYYDWLVEQMNAGVSGFVSSTTTYTDYDFVVNQTDQTFRLPLKNGQEGVFADGVKGNGMTLGLTDGTKNGGLWFSSAFALDASTTSYGTTVGTPSSDNVLSNSKDYGITTDPSKSGMIVDKTVPSGWNLYYYVGDTVQDASLINAGAVLGQLSDKISRTATSDKELVVGWGMPDWNTEVQLSGTAYTATYKCWLISLTNISNTAEALLYINGKLVTKEYGDYAQLQIPLDVGDVVTSNTTFQLTSVYAMKGL